MRNIEDDINALWGFLWRSKMIGSIIRTDEIGKERAKYFLNDYGKQIFTLMRKRYKLDETDEMFNLDDKKHVKLLVVCPFCGGKTEQGLLKCQKCSAEL